MLLIRHIRRGVVRRVRRRLRLWLRLYWATHIDCKTTCQYRILVDQVRKKTYLGAAEENATLLLRRRLRRQDLLLVWSLWASVAAGQRQLVTVVGYTS